MFELPSELTTKPLALIGLTGLDITNPVHRSIWDAFSNNRRLQVSVIQFKLLSLTHEFPTVKPKVYSIKQLESIRILIDYFLKVNALLIMYFSVIHTNGIYPKEY